MKLIDFAKIAADIEAAVKEQCTLNVCGVEVDTTETVKNNYQKWWNNVRLPAEKTGAIGGQLTLKITPTSIGTIYVAEHSSGATFELNDWRLFG